jgi:hypothetical protein
MNTTPICMVEKSIITKRGINSNYQYRRYMTENAESVMKSNFQTALAETGWSGGSFSLLDDTATISNAGDIPFGAHITSVQPKQRERVDMDYPPLKDSDMRGIYMSKQEMTSRMEYPAFAQYELLRFGRSN